MFHWNVIKGVELFDDFYVSSDCDEILAEAKVLGAKTIKRETGHLTEAPNIEWYKYCYGFMDSPDAIVAVQINSPTLDKFLLTDAKFLLKSGFNEVMTVNKFKDNGNYHDKSAAIYGSVWGITKERLFTYKDPWNPDPDVLLFDDSVDIHTEEDLQKAIKQYNPNQ